ncbi:hypothetical protein GCM10010435_31690 [Winogradskya consettensis]|uniref:Acyltransferase 3 domain-containing protein n=1 Tax=Winogradskya consettensis TaxID=113560 RepID=A0A919SEM3_9ACTN|nr:acyltransferase [Actinoplanes consettensis]GIM70355.1 hypothetical protein Aco04nite_19810 [Actinoplanes consettensis]
MKREHLAAVDLVRVLTVGLVVGVHTVSQQPGGTGLTNGALLTVMHVSREVFFLLTAFVLCYSYRDREPRRWTAFWKRRYLLVGVPYLVWSVIYHLAVRNDGLAREILTGTAQYHLYFLLVSMQLYLVFPLLRRLLSATAGRHGRLLTVAVVYQLAAYHFLHPNALLISYLGFVVVGGIAATHAPAFLALTRRHQGRIFTGTAVVLAAGIGWFLVQVLLLGRSTVTASAVFQPVVVLESFAVAWSFLAAGLAWESRPRWVRTAADASFGVYLAHPLILQALLALGLGTAAAGLPGPVVTVLAMTVVVPLVYLGCVAGVVLLRRTPLSLPLTGHTISYGGLLCARRTA